ncbi:SNF2 family N-terminal domain-containing protein [Annulohypoxylon nitens]|nr:SNF2 family N-terminal domain-containing protein [Annulohypoxylon nitens]
MTSLEKLICMSNIYNSAHNPHEICFGMLCDIPIQWISVASVQGMNSAISRAAYRNDISDAKLQFSDGRSDVVDPSGKTIAMLNNKTYLALSKVLASINAIRFSLVTNSAEQGNLPLRGSIDKSSVDCLVFGPRSVSNDLAKELSKCRMFLQHPVPLPSDYPYENPQYLNIAGASFSNGSILPAIRGFHEAGTDCNVSRSQQDNEQQTDTLLSVLDSIPQHNYLKEAEIDPRISTVLLHHQKEGVDFILRREGIYGSNPRSLWKNNSPGQDCQIFHHVITKSTSDKPYDTLGGILADAMGVGKTLTMIASIASSQKEEKYNVQPADSEEHSMTWKPSHKNSTLILVPSVLLLDGWIAEIDKHVVLGTLRYYKYHGPNRSLSISSNLPYDIVLATYGTVTADLRAGGGVLNTFKWYRLVLDEAHFIRNWSTKQFKAVMQLNTVIRWCMTGTPIQNSLEDLASLVRFLRVPILEDISTFRRCITGRKKTASGMTKPNFDHLRLLLGSICLRRTTSVLSQLNVIFTTCKPKLSAKEREVYNELARACQRSIEETVSSQNTQQISQKPILEALLRMRIFCNLGLETGIDDKATLNPPHQGLSVPQQDNARSCMFCTSYVDDICEQEDQSIRQNHGTFCAECAPQRSHKMQGNLSVNSSSRSNIRDKRNMAPDTSMIKKRSPDQYDPGECPSKLRVLLDNIKRQSLEDKIIVFSSWIKSLDAVARLMTDHNITFRRIDGSLPVSERKQILSEFQNPSIRVLLMTLGTGAIGLNQLSIASQLHLLEPQWNPSVETQAIGRVVRLGQEKKVTITRYVTVSTIEESVDNRQALKLRLSVAGGLQLSSSDYAERIRGLRELAEAIQTQLKS